jgi:hypothetical protein
LEPAPDAIPASVAEPDATQVQASIREPASIPVRGGILERPEVPAVSVIPAVPVAALTSIPVEAEKQAAAAGFEPQAQAGIAERVWTRALLFRVEAGAPALIQAQAVQAAVDWRIRALAAALPSEQESMLKDDLPHGQPGPVSVPTDGLPRADLELEPDALLRDAPPLGLGGNPRRAQLEPIGHRSEADSQPLFAAARDSGWRTGLCSASPSAHCCAGPAAVPGGAHAVPPPVLASDGNSVRHCHRCS